MIKQLNNSNLEKIIGGGYCWSAFSIMRSVAMSGYHHRGDIRRGYYMSPFHY